jgi:hypothetical protein
MHAAPMVSPFLKSWNGFAALTGKHHTLPAHVPFNQPTAAPKSLAFRSFDHCAMAAGALHEVLLQSDGFACPEQIATDNAQCHLCLTNVLHRQKSSLLQWEFSASPKCWLGCVACGLNADCNATFHPDGGGNASVTSEE